MPELTPEVVRQLASEYPPGYDDSYFQNIDAGRRGDIEALKALTEWKNPSANGRPMKFESHLRKRSAWEYFLRGLNDYLPNGREKLRADFESRAPVWAMFWHHVLYGTPIFDRYTNIAFSHFVEDKTLSRDQGAIYAGGHWALYDRYCAWFDEQFDNVTFRPNLTFVV